MGTKIRPYIHKCWTWGAFKQVCLLPAVYVTHSSGGHFVETGVYTDLWIVSVNFLVWDIGIQIHKDI